MFNVCRPSVGDLVYYEAYAPVAQWIEQETSKLLAVGSIPTRGTKMEIFR